MKAIRKSDGAIIDVRLYDVDTATGKFIFTDDSTNTHYNKADLDFNVEEAEEVTIDGWVARDRLNNALFLHDEKPYRAFSGYQTDGKEDEWRSETCPPYPIDYDSFPSVTWESDPLEVTVIIKPKKKSSTE